MIVFRKKDELNAKISSLKEENTTVGFVPTMGALHQGHLSLVEEALANNNLVIVSVFVNPTQFDNSEDLKKYPRNLQQDVDLLNTLSDKIIVYAPTVEDIYEGETKSQKFNFDGLEHQMEGKFRDGHFDGVGTIVKLLFDIVKPNNAYFGEKDFQQLAIIKKLVSKYNIPVNIVGCKIKRDANGLALSSRNTRLKPEHKVVAPFIYKTLKAAKEKFGTKSANKVIEWVENQFANHELLELEYFTIADEATLKTAKRKSKNKQYRAFIAVYAGKIRLIDNIALN
ncbi:MULTISPECIES: pantoate--beta-alanine ligase [Mesoflavibacter]|uniref:pantoate--beta-alanine ligase n=1 Tax=Mesoflavibacter TaxID=444051 RepID=UPI0003FE741D|nr:pantoate--beta-alanine ligase [Mesoflavibacter zeaxanthinifaciens]